MRTNCLDCYLRPGSKHQLASQECAFKQDGVCSSKLSTLIAKSFSLKQGKDLMHHEMLYDDIWQYLNYLLVSTLVYIRCFMFLRTFLTLKNSHLFWNMRSLIFDIGLFPGDSVPKPKNQDHTGKTRPYFQIFLFHRLHAINENNSSIGYLRYTLWNKRKSVNYCMIFHGRSYSKIFTYYLSNLTNTRFLICSLLVMQASCFGHNEEKGEKGKAKVK